MKKRKEKSSFLNTGQTSVISSQKSADGSAVHAERAAKCQQHSAQEAAGRSNAKEGSGHGCEGEGSRRRARNAGATDGGQCCCMSVGGCIVIDDGHRTINFVGTSGD